MQVRSWLRKRLKVWELIGGFNNSQEEVRTFIPDPVVSSVSLANLLYPMSNASMPS
jgi:hypothetical protein